MDGGSQDKSRGRSLGVDDARHSAFPARYADSQRDKERPFVCKSFMGSELELSSNVPVNIARGEFLTRKAHGRSDLQTTALKGSSDHRAPQIATSPAAVGPHKNAPTYGMRSRTSVRHLSKSRI